MAIMKKIRSSGGTDNRPTGLVDPELTNKSAKTGKRCSQK
jgi:hypothetical protein